MKNAFVKLALAAVMLTGSLFVSTRTARADTSDCVNACLSDSWGMCNGYCAFEGYWYCQCLYYPGAQACGWFMGYCP
jgi:hypothetical protein